MTKNLDVFENDPVPKAVAKLALPTVASMMVNVVYNMVDTFFVGKLADPNKVAAVSIATPVFLFLMAAGNMFGIGGSSFISRALGEKKVEKVKHISSFCFYGGIIVGVLGALFFSLVCRQFFRLSAQAKTLLLLQASIFCVSLMALLL